MSLSSSEPSFSVLRIPKILSLSLLWAVPLHVIGALAVLVLSAGLYLKTVWDQGAWLVTGAWSMLVFYSIVGVAGGIAAGILSAAHRTLEALEATLHEGLSRLPALTTSPGREPFSLDEARVHYATLLDRLLDQALGYVPLPDWLNRFVRSWIQDAVVGDFIARCRDKGLSRIPPQEFRNWVLARGATLALSPLHDQLSIWQYVVFGTMGFLACGALVLSYVMA